MSNLVDAVQKGDLPVVEDLLRAGRNINTVDKDDKTPLFIASQKGHIEIVKVLLGAGAAINKANNVGSTPLFIASQHGHLEIVKTLLAAGADVNKAKGSGATPLFIASQRGHLEIAKALLEAGADVSKVIIESGSTPLHVASQEGHLEVVKTLLAAGADLNKVKKDSGATPLYIASQFGHLETVKALLAAGANVNLYNVLAKARRGKFSKEINHAIIAAKPTQVDMPKWKGITQGDVSRFDTIFDTTAPPGQRSPAENISICPVCHKQVFRESGCLYMNHNCAESGGYYHNELYQKYKNTEGKIAWCTSCGRICKGHRHYALGSATDPLLPTLLTGVGDPFENDCSKTNGGGGPLEKLARFRRLRETMLSLQDEVGRMNEVDSLNEMVEETWNAPMIAKLSKVNTRKLNTIKATKKWNIPTNVFPPNVAPVATKVLTTSYSSDGKYLEPKLHMPGSADYGEGNTLLLDDTQPVIQFIHKPYTGGELNDHSATHMYISKQGLMSYLQDFGMRGGKCFDDECKAHLYPEEIMIAFEELKAAMGADYVTEKDIEVLNNYKQYFMEHMVALKGGHYRIAKTNTTRRKKQRGGASALPFFQPADDASCVIVPRRLNIKKTRKTRRRTWRPLYT